MASKLLFGTVGPLAGALLGAIAWARDHGRDIRRGQPAAGRRLNGFDRRR